MIHQGKTLKQQIKLSGRKVDAVAKDVGVVRTTIYDWYKEEVLPAETLEKLKAAGIDLTKGGRQLSYAKAMQADPEAPKPYYANVNTSAGLSMITTNTQAKASEYIDVPNSGAEFFINVF